MPIDVDEVDVGVVDVGGVGATGAVPNCNAEDEDK